MKDEIRTCAYCGNIKCRCQYRYGRMGGLSMSIQNITEQTTMAEARESFEQTFGSFAPDTKLVFLFSITKLSPEKMAKARLKRAVK